MDQTTRDDELLRPMEVAHLCQDRLRISESSYYKRLHPAVSQLLKPRGWGGTLQLVRKSEVDAFIDRLIRHGFEKAVEQTEGIDLDRIELE